MRVHVSASNKMDLALHPTPAPAHCTGTRLSLLQTRWISEIFSFFVRGPARCPPKYAGTQSNGGSERLAGAVLPRPVLLQPSPLLVPQPHDQKPMSITVSPKLTPGRVRPGHALHHRAPDPSPAPGFPTPGSCRHAASPLTRTPPTTAPSQQAAASKPPGLREP